MAQRAAPLNDAFKMDPASSENQAGWDWIDLSAVNSREPRLFGIAANVMGMRNVPNSPRH